ncbi:hypothetical protein [Streptomyces aureus]|uniref:hypothetical protein n=1 Tax=Streptomyces aureus TaxID=193461 RepID=UPI003681BA76
MPQNKATSTPAEDSAPTVTGLQITLAAFTMSLVATVVGTALYGPEEQSERAFRLLHWWKRDPQPAPDAPRRTQRTKRHS